MFALSCLAAQKHYTKKKLALPEIRGAPTCIELGLVPGVDVFNPVDL